MVEGRGIGIGMGIGIFMGILIGIIASPFVDNLSNQPNPIADIIQIDDARLAHIEASYYEDNDRLIVALILTNKDAEYAKADGHLKLTVRDELYTKYYSNEYDVTRDDFFSWKTNFGEKITGYRVDEHKFFASGDYDVYVDFTKKDGRVWKELHTSFRSWE